MSYGLDDANGGSRGLNAEEADAFDAMQSRDRSLAEDPESYRQWCASLVVQEANTFRCKYSLAALAALVLGVLLRA